MCDFKTSTCKIESFLYSVLSNALSCFYNDIIEKQTDYDQLTLTLV